MRKHDHMSKFNISNNDDEMNEIPVSPISSIVSRGNVPKYLDTQWDQYL